MKNLFTTILVLVALTCFSQIPTGYYDNAEGLSGDELKTALHNIIKNHTEYPYTDSGTDVWDILKESDRDPNNSANVILIYTGWSVNAAQEWNGGAGWSREHVWAKSRGDFGTDPPEGTDAHHLSPCDPSVNSARNNRWFNYCDEEYYDGGVATGSYTSSTNWYWQPRDEVKGDVARMIFYMATRYEGENGELNLEVIDYIPSDQYTNDPVHAKLDALLDWNAEDPVDDFERNRNEVVFSYQGNRNPFIDHPEYVNAIYVENLAPVINNQEFTIAENSNSGTEVGTVEASDPDNDDLTFSILSGNTDDAFAINTSTGLLTVNNSDALDYETTPSFDLSVEVSDGSLASNATITINIEDATGFSPIACNFDIKIYPNPVISNINIDAPDNYSFEIYSIIGERIISNKEKQVDVSHLDAGIYFVVIKNEIGNTVKSEKVIKK